MTPADPSDVAPLEEDQLDELAAYLAAWPDETLRADAWRRRFDHWWTANPYFAAAQPPRGLTIRSAGRIVGFFGLVPMTFQLSGRDVTAYGSTTWRVDPAFRHRSLAAIGRVLAACRGSLLFVWTGTAGLVKVLEALRFVQLPRPACFRGRQQTTLLLRPGRVLGAEYGALAGAAGTVLSLHPALVLARARIGGRRFQARRVDRAGPEFDHLWERTRHQVAHTQARTSVFLNWHCFGGAVGGPPLVEKWLYGCWRDGQLVGSLVGCIKLVRTLRVLDIADVWIDPASATGRILDAFFAELIRGALRSHVDAVELPHYSSDIHRFALTHALLPRAVDDRTELVFASPQILAELKAGTSYFSGLVGDRYL